MNILLGLTGSVASKLAPKLISSLSQLGTVKVVMTESALPFVSADELRKQLNYGNQTVMRDVDEWKWADVVEDIPTTSCQHTIPRYDYKKDDPVLHIELRKWADVFVVAPLTMNTLAKMANGLCDNLLTSVFRAWDWDKPVVIAPAANTLMWQSPFTEKHLNVLKELGVVVVPPISKELACKDEGEGALARIEDIQQAIYVFMVRLHKPKECLTKITESQCGECNHCGGIVKMPRDPATFTLQPDGCWCLLCGQRYFIEDPQDLEKFLGYDPKLEVEALKKRPDLSQMGVEVIDGNFVSKIDPDEEK